MQDALQSWAIGLVRALDLQELRLEKQKHTSTLFKKKGGINVLQEQNKRLHQGWFYLNLKQIVQDSA